MVSHTMKKLNARMPVEEVQKRYGAIFFVVHVLRVIRDFLRARIATCLPCWRVIFNN